MDRRSSNRAEGWRKHEMVTVVVMIWENVKGRYIEPQTWILSCGGYGTIPPLFWTFRKASTHSFEAAYWWQLPAPKRIMIVPGKLIRVEKGKFSWKHVVKRKHNTNQRSQQSLWELKSLQESLEILNSLFTLGVTLPSVWMMEEGVDF